MPAVKPRASRTPTASVESPVASSASRRIPTILSRIETSASRVRKRRAADGNRVTVKVIHERDQFLQEIPPREFPMTHSVRSPHGDFWSVNVGGGFAMRRPARGYEYSRQRPT